MRDRKGALYGSDRRLDEEGKERTKGRRKQDRQERAKYFNKKRRISVCLQLVKIRV